MNLLFLSNLYPPQALGGYEQLCQEVSERLLQRGHRITILTTNYKVGAGEMQDSAVNGVRVIRSLYLDAPIDYYRPSDFFRKRKREEAHNHQELRGVVDKIKPDLLVVWGMWNLSPNLPHWAEALLPNRVAYYLCSYWPTDDDPHTAYWNLPANRKRAALLKWPLKTWVLSRLHSEGYPPALRFQHSACVSKYVRDTLVEAGKLPVSAMVVPNGIDPTPYTQTERSAVGEPIRLLYFGRLVADKGVHTAIEALGLLAQRGLGNRVQLTILGGGHPDYEAHLHHLAEERKVTGRIRFVKSVPREDVPQWLAQHDVFLFTSIWAEPMARSVMEAMASGMLVIGSTVGGQKEMLVNQGNSLTFPADDAIALADQIGWAIDHPTECESITGAGKAMVLERFTLDRMIENMEGWLSGILER